MKILTIIVTYNPSISVLNKLITSLHNQTLDNRKSNNIIIIDNNSNNINGIDSLDIETIKLNKNIGIASAQNIGLQKAINDNYNYVLLSDQDTSYPNDYITKLIHHITDDVASIGSMFLNKTTNLREGYVKSLGFKKYSQPTAGVHKSLFTIASGTIINISNLSQIGLMAEELFIDYVDIEWCLRAKSKGFEILINSDTLLEHSIGEESISVLGNTYPDRSAKRMYFLTRNGIYLFFYCKYLSLTQRLSIFLKTFIYIYFYSSRGIEKTKKLKHCFIGIYHGLIKKMGNPL
ncbi:glycosyltransferase family 2 protein [Francisella sp. 19X1-34]|uniref:glycosyltransferase family 2 protein n=1 Tax=Francisella sp. 19X1-34 TaxID=3087177 RepID=UPI002E301E05|nr:glycosyltransferase family 2 protein [Francisella sp. 19X1-34]MED7787564.1 glycosyltransferase family 2 protein [Francisella sp. 19X1-34]